MARVGYVRVRRKQEIEEFENKANVEKIFIDLTDEFGFTNGESLKSMLEQLEVQDTVVIRNLCDVADDVIELRKFIVTLRDMDVALVMLESNDLSILTQQGYETLSMIVEFQKDKAKGQQSKQMKAGRPSKPYPPNFLEVYEAYRTKNVNGSKSVKGLSGPEAAKKLSISYNKFRELVKIFELKV